MKDGKRFLLKVTAVSILLFALWHPLSHAYAFVLDRLLSLFYPQYLMLEKNDMFPYLSSLGLIPLVSLTVATPSMHAIKKTAIITSGIFIFIVSDFLFIEIGTSEGGSAWYGIYRSLKWLLPFILWIIPSYQHLNWDKSNRGSNLYS